MFFILYWVNYTLQTCTFTKISLYTLHFQLCPSIRYDLGQVLMWPFHPCVVQLSKWKEAIWAVIEWKVDIKETLTLDQKRKGLTKNIISEWSEVKLG